MSGLANGTGLSQNTGLYGGNEGLYGGASGLINGGGSTPPSAPALLMEDGSFLLLEDGSKILLE
jgi:hypothetical protein